MGKKISVICCVVILIFNIISGQKVVNAAATNEVEYYELTLEKNVTYEIENKGNSYYYILPIDNTSSSNNFSYISTNKDGSISGIDYDASYSIILNINQKMRFRLNSGSIKLKVPVETEGSMIKTNVPIFHQFKALKGESYEFLNNDKDISILNNAQDNNSKYSCVSYDKGGNITSLIYDRVSNLVASKGERVKLAVDTTKPMDVYIPYEFKDSYKKLDTPIIEKVLMLPNETYTMFNSTNNSLVFNTSTSTTFSETYDLIKKDIYGDIISLAKNTRETLSLNAKERINLSLCSGDSLILYLPYEYKDMLKKDDKKVFHEERIEAGKSVTIKNTTERTTILLDNFIATSSYYDLDMYDEYGVLKYSKEHIMGRVTIPEGYTAKITNNGIKAMSFFMPYDFKYPATSFAKEDINKDSYIDILDISYVAEGYNLTKNDVDYKLIYDINNDGIIDIYDIVSVSRKII